MPRISLRNNIDARKTLRPLEKSLLKSAVLFCGLLLMALTSAWAEEPSGKLKLTQFLQDLNTYQAEFLQLSMQQGESGEYRSKGTFYLSRPGRFRWQYREPDNQYLLADGKDIWFVEEELAQVTQRSQRRALKGTPAMMLISDIDIEKQFVINEQGDGLGLTWLELIPRDEDSQFEQILMAFENEDLRKLEMADKFGQVTRIDFVQTTRNPELDPTLFKFIPPEGYDILSQDE